MSASASASDNKEGEGSGLVRGEDKADRYREWADLVRGAKEGEESPSEEEIERDLEREAKRRRYNQLARQPYLMEVGHVIAPLKLQPTIGTTSAHRFLGFVDRPPSYERSLPASYKYAFITPIRDREGAAAFEKREQVYAKAKEFDEAGLIAESAIVSFKVVWRDRSSHPNHEAYVCPLFPSISVCVCAGSISSARPRTRSYWPRRLRS